MGVALRFGCIAALVAAGTIGQQTSNQTPPKAKLSAGSETYRFPQIAKFTLKLDSAPRSTGKAEIVCQFKYSREQGSTSTPEYMVLTAMEVAEAKVPTQDGVLEYQISLPVGALFKPGKWELSSVSFGENGTLLHFSAGGAETVRGAAPFGV